MGKCHQLMSLLININNAFKAFLLDFAVIRYINVRE